MAIRVDTIVRWRTRILVIVFRSHNLILFRLRRIVAMSHQDTPIFSAADHTRVTVYSREGCHLCADALDVVSRVCQETGEQFLVVDIDGSLDLVEKFSDYVPVVEVDGIQQGFWRIDEARLRRALA